MNHKEIRKMKLQAHKNELKTNAKFKSQDFGIGDPSVVIEILRNKLYKHKIRTLVQEYISNARDAMREIKSDKAIKITLPTRFDPTFKVRDFGLGITPDRMENVFILYGSSTKRDSNNQTGGFGIGAKIAWAYTDSFTIVTFIDGIKRIYIAHTGVGSNGRLDLLSEESTNELNGTEIQVAVAPRDISSFRDACFRATYFWSEAVEFTGPHDADRKHESGEKFNKVLEILNKDLHKSLPNYIQNNYYKEPLAVIDGIPYSLDDTISNKVPALRKLDKLIKGQLILHVPTGYLGVAASREEVDTSDYSMDNLKRLCIKLHKEINAHIKTEFAKADSVFEYLHTYVDLSHSYNVQDYSKHDAYEVDMNVLRSNLFNKMNLFHCSKHMGNLKKVNRSAQNKKRGHIQAQAAIEKMLFNRLFFIENGESVVKQNKRIREHLETVGSMILVTPKDTFQTEYNKVKADLGLKDLTTIKPNETPVTSFYSKPIRDKMEFCIHALRSTYRYSNDYIFSRDKIYKRLKDNDQKWLYIPMKGNAIPEYDKYELYMLDKYLRSMTDYRICGLSQASVKIVKGNKNFKPLSEYLNKLKPSAKDLARIKGKESSPLLRKITEALSDHKDISDKFLVDRIKDYKTLEFDKLPDILFKKFKNAKEVLTFIANEDKFIELLNTKYPLLWEADNVNHKYVKELVYYINCKNKKEV